MFHVLFVCTGNICRSPLAEGMLRHWLARDLVSGVEVSSAGTYANDGAPASAHGVTVAGENGFDTSGHEARLVHKAILEKADLILAMEVDHIFDILRIAPEVEGRVFPLGGYALADGSAADLSIFDPVGRDLVAYRKCHAIIEHHLTRAYPEIRKVITAAQREAREKGEG